ncbi:MAG TPA: transcription antitermination factor NusB [Terriglobales bacterium]|jgi:16S rRNA (cytosine967-C5)-methyltransferase|nr:transcription antitermination factor NusB [Terriglobales bacterium]
MLSPSRTAAFDILMRVEQGAFADELLHSERLDKLTPADRSLCMEIVMGVLRWRSRLDESIATWSKTPPQRLDPEVVTALRIGVYQLAHLERVPAHAAVDQTVELVKRAGRRFAAPMANAVMRKIAAAKPGPPPLTIEEGSLDLIATATAHPRWLLERWETEYGPEAARQIAHYDQQVPVPALRLRDPEADSDLPREGIELAPGALAASARRVISGDVTKTRAFAEGRAYLQGEASQLVALLVGHGARILDCCAAPGGKTSVIAERNPSSLVVATDLHPARARLMRRLVRARNVLVVAASAEALPLMPDFDRALADVPCSGTGTLARNPEIKWRLRPEDLPDLHRRQVSILRAALGYLVPGGRLVYSTCSLEREENEDVVGEVIADRSDLRLLDCRDELQRLQAEGELIRDDPKSLVRGKLLRTLPGVHPCDGFFAAIVERVPA